MGAGGDGGQAVASWISDQVRGSRGEEEGNLQLSRRGVSAPGAKPPRQQTTSILFFLFFIWVSLGRRRDLWLLVLVRPPDHPDSSGSTL